MAHLPKFPPTKLICHIYSASTHFQLNRSCKLVSMSHHRPHSSGRGVCDSDYDISSGSEPSSEYNAYQFKHDHKSSDPTFYDHTTYSPVDASLPIEDNLTADYEHIGPLQSFGYIADNVSDFSSEFYCTYSMSGHPAVHHPFPEEVQTTSSALDLDYFTGLSPSSIPHSHNSFDVHVPAHGNYTEPIATSRYDDVKIVRDEGAPQTATSLLPDPMAKQNMPRFNGDEYTAKWVKGEGIDRAGWCSICSDW